MQNKILAAALEKLHSLQNHGNVFQGKDFKLNQTRVLKKAGFIKPIIKGWYHLSNPSDNESETTMWYASFWEFTTKYFQSRFGRDYVLNPDASLSLYTGDTVIPKQIVAITKFGNSSTVKLPSGLSILMYSDNKKFPSTIEQVKGAQVMSLESALCQIGPQFFRDKQKEAEIALGMIKEPSSLIRVLLKEERMDTAAGRIVGALRFVGRNEEADRIKSTYETATSKYISIVEPFNKEARRLVRSREKCSASLRIEAMWYEWRDVVAEIGKTLVAKGNIDAIEIVTEMEGKYRNDAYHSLSIEGYRVTPELIDKVASGNWDPEASNSDSSERDALAARGYFEAFNSVKDSIVNVINNKDDIATVIAKEHHTWFEALFSPSVRVGILEGYHLAGYRDTQVYLRGSSHVPLAKEEIADSMDVLFERLTEEEDGFVRAVLGHHLFVFIHPYVDGNGRTARFIMNAFLVTSGYPWIIIKVEDRNLYMAALEEASVNRDIGVFASFIAERVKNSGDVSKSV